MALAVVEQISPLPSEMNCLVLYNLIWATALTLQAPRAFYLPVGQRPSVCWVVIVLLGRK